MFDSKYEIWLSPPHLSGNELGYIKKALDTNWVSPYGENIDSFESSLEKYYQVPDVALTNSGTAAIHLSLILAGVKEGDDVIVPTLNFAGCVNPILYLKANPVFIDSEYKNFNVNPDLAGEVIEKRVKQGRKPAAIIGVDLFGYPCKIDEIQTIADKYGIPFIEDAADAIGALYKGAPAGSFGAMGVLSFNGNKIITTSGGGALISRDPELVSKAKYLSNQARSGAPYYNHADVGYNYMLSNVLAGIGLAQLPELEERVKRRREIQEVYRKEFSDIDFISFPTDLPGTRSNGWLSVMRIHSDSQEIRNGLYDHLRIQEIESRPVWKPMHMQKAFRDFPYYGDDVAIRLFNEGLCLPSGSELTDAQVEKVVESVRKFLVQARLRA
jgi:dTDP-4-amino-4,6-dideoxygalactose transaminase